MAHSFGRVGTGGGALAHNLFHTPEIVLLALVVGAPKLGTSDTLDILLRQRVQACTRCGAVIKDLRERLQVVLLPRVPGGPKPKTGHTMKVTVA